MIVDPSCEHSQIYFFDIFRNLESIMWYFPHNPEDMEHKPMFFYCWTQTGDEDASAVDKKVVDKMGTKNS